MGRLLLRTISASKRLFGRHLRLANEESPVRGCDPLVISAVMDEEWKTIKAFKCQRSGVLDRHDITYDGLTEMEEDSHRFDFPYRHRFRWWWWTGWRVGGTGEMLSRRGRSIILFRRGVYLTKAKDNVSNKRNNALSEMKRIPIGAVMKGEASRKRLGSRERVKGSTQGIHE